MSDCSHNCESCGENCPSRQGGIPKEQLNAASRVKRVIGVVSGKGGVGKSLVTSLLATTFQRRGCHAAILDADVTGLLSPRRSVLQKRPWAVILAYCQRAAKPGLTLCR